MGPNTYFYQNGWPGAIGFPLPGASRGCGCGSDCGSFPPPFPQQRDCGKGEPFLDSANVIYHLFNNQISQLVNLNLPNGTPAQVIFDTIDAQLGNLNVSLWDIPNLKSYFPYTNFNNLRTFGQVVDVEFGVINAALIALTGSTVALSATNTETIDFSLSGTLNRNISANVNVSSQSGNTLSVLGDGLFAAPQTLNVNYTTNQITISGTGGNTVQLPNAPAGYLGNLSADPSGTILDGSYWYNTTSSQLKIRVNGATRVISIT